MSSAPPIVAVTAVVPCLDEQECLPQAYDEIKQSLVGFADHEIIFIDDGSTDGTLALLREFASRDHRVRYISFTRNFGLEAAFGAGFRYASLPWIAQFDADLQSPPSELPKLLAKAEEGYDVVFAMRNRRRDPAWRRFGSTAQHWVARNLLAIELPWRGSIFRVIRTSVAQKIVALNLGTPYFLATVPLVGARYTSVRTEHHERRAGLAKWNLATLVGHSMELFTSFSYRLLNLVQFNVLLAVVVLLAGLVSESAGAHVLGALTLLMLVVVAFDLAVMSRYLIRIVRGQSRGPAAYLVRETNIDIDPADSLYEFELRPRAPRSSLAVTPAETGTVGATMGSS